MTVKLNHTIVWCRDKKVSAPFMTEILGLADPQPFGPFLVVEAANDVSLDFTRPTLRSDLSTTPS